MFLVYLFNKLIMCLLIALQVNLQIMRFLTHGLNSHNHFIYIYIYMYVCICRIINYWNLEKKPQFRNYWTYYWSTCWVIELSKVSALLKKSTSNHMLSFLIISIVITLSTYFQWLQWVLKEPHYCHHLFGAVFVRLCHCTKKKCLSIRIIVILLEHIYL